MLTNTRAGYPQAWSYADIALDSAPSADASIEEEDEDDENETESATDPTSTSTFVPSPTFSRLLTHLSLACSSHPTPLYPTILLLLPTIPASILPVSGEQAPFALNLLFDNFYSAYSSRAVTIGGPSASEAWLSALLECLIFETSKVEDKEASRTLCTEWVGKVWRAFLNFGEEAKTRGLATRRTAEEVEKALTRLAAREDKTSFEAVWEVIEKEAADLFVQEETSSKSLDALAMALKAILRSTSSEVKEKGRDLVKRQVTDSIGVIQQGREEGREDMLRFLSSTKDLAKGDQEVQQQVDELCLRNLPAAISTSPSSLPLLVSHLSTTSPTSRSSIWESLFATSPSPSTFLRLIDAVSDARLGQDLPSAQLDTQVLKMADKVLSSERSGSNDELEILRRIMLQPEPFVDPSLPTKLFDLAVKSLENTVSPALQSSSSPSPTSLSSLIASTALLANYAQSSTNSKQIASSDSAVISLSQVAHLLPNSRLEAALPDEAVAAAQRAWQHIVHSGGDQVVTEAMKSLKSQLVDVNSRPSAIEGVQAGASLLSSSPSSGLSLSDLLPEPETFTDLYNKLSLSEPSADLSVIEPLVTAHDSSPVPAPSSVDSAFLTSYPRAVLAFLDIASRDHSLARRSLWILPHLLLVAYCAKDQLALSSKPTGMFGKSIPTEILERLVGACEGASSYLLSSAANLLPDGWHATAVTHLRSKEAASTEDQLLNVLGQLASQAKGNGAKAGYAQRAVATVLSAALRYSEGGVQDAERWLALAQNLTSGKISLSFFARVQLIV